MEGAALSAPKQEIKKGFDGSCFVAKEVFADFAE
jgi:hypothetical protein